MSEPFDAKGFIRTLRERGWEWSPAEADLLVHPTDHDLAVRYDAATDKLSISPKLDAHLALIIPTPPGKSKTFIR